MRMYKSATTNMGAISMGNKVAVKLADGTILSLSDLPNENTKRWVASNKSTVVRVFMAGLITRDEVIKKYNLSNEEFESWLNRYISGGKQALKVVNIGKLRKQDKDETES